MDPAPIGFLALRVHGGIPAFLYQQTLFPESVHYPELIKILFYPLIISLLLIFAGI
jgi:hypothetical protein